MDVVGLSICFFSTLLFLFFLFSPQTREVKGHHISSRENELDFRDAQVPLAWPHYRRLLSFFFIS